MSRISRGAIHIFLSVAWVSAVVKDEEASGNSIGAYPFRSYVMIVTHGY
jgi:hypothetical protein